MKLDPKGADHLEDGGKGGIAFRGKRLVEAFARQTGVVRKLRHAARAGNVTQGTDQAPVAGILSVVGTEEHIGPADAVPCIFDCMTASPYGLKRIAQIHFIPLLRLD